MADVSFTNLTNLPPDIATELENINRKRRIQDALMAQTLQQPQTQVTGGKYSRAVPYSPLEGATKLIQAAMLSKASDKNNQALRQLGQRYGAESGEEVRNLQAQAAGGVPWREPDPTGAITTGAGSVYPEARRVSEAMMNMQRTGSGNRARPTGSTSGYFVMDNGKPRMLSHPATGEPLVPSYADPSMRYQYSQAGEAGKGQAQMGYKPPLEAAVTAAEQGVASPLTPAQKEVDTGFAQDYQEYVASGGYADIQKGINQLRGTAEQLKEGKNNLSGPIMSAQPEWLFKRTFPEAAAARDAVAEVVQRNLRLILGGQFAQKEGEMLSARAYDVALPEEENLKRVNRLIKSIEEAAKAKEESIKYYEENGTLQGFTGKQYTISDFMNAVEGGETTKRTRIKFDAQGNQIP